ncbi:MAG: LysE family transporter [Sneathiella sp.]|nr:LysE family transporter [Sneathiella sp.]
MSELLILFIKGLGLGAAVAAPVGPVGALCIRRAVILGRIPAITSGIGAAVADAFYGSVAAFGLTAVSAFMIQYQDPAALIGGLFLLWLSFRIVRSSGETAVPAKTETSKSKLKGFVTTFLLTMTNPVTILSFIAIFAGIGFINTASGGKSASLLVLGVFLGSTLWWVFLAFFATFLQKRLGNHFTSFVNIGSAVIIGLFGLFTLASLLVS